MPPIKLIQDYLCISIHKTSVNYENPKTNGEKQPLENTNNDKLDPSVNGSDEDKTELEEDNDSEKEEIEEAPDGLQDDKEGDDDKINNRSDEGMVVALVEEETEEQVETDKLVEQSF